MSAQIAFSADKSKNPQEVLAESEQQWIFTDDDLRRTPSCVHGMSYNEERRLRGKGVQFISQVMAMLKLPQVAIYTASVFFNRFLMRYNLVPKDSWKPLHHYV
jgi:protein BUR2